MHPAAARHLERPLQYAQWCGRGGTARCPPIPIYGAQRALVWSPILHDWQFQPKLDGARNRNEPAARYGSSPDSPLEGDGLELLVPQQESPGFPKRSGSCPDGRGPIRLRPPSRSSASARPHRHIAVPAQVWARLSLYPAGVSAPSWRKGTERGIQNPCVDGPASQGLVAAGRRESTIHANIASGRTQHLYPCSGVLFRRRTSDRRSRRRSIFLNLSLA